MKTTQASTAEKSIRAYARNARLAVWLQLGAAALAFVATIVFGFMISGQTAKLAAVNTELDAASSRLATTDNATQAVLQAASALASGEGAQYDAAIKSLDAVRKDLGSITADLEAKKADAALAELRKVHFSVTRTLASALFTRPGRTDDDLARAIDLETENLSGRELADPQYFHSAISLATYQCDRNNEAAVKALLTRQFVATYPDTRVDGVLPDRCRAMAGIPPATIPAFNPDTANSEFLIATLHMQIAEERDRSLAQQLATTLCRNGYRIYGIETVDAAKVKGGGVIYYYPEQASEATAIAAIVREAYPDGHVYELRPRQLIGFDNLVQDTAEIWLPPSGRDWPPPAPSFSCRPDTPSGDSNVPALIARLISDDKADRLAAGQALANQIRTANDGEAIAALIAQLKTPRLEQLSAAARLNVLYMLNIETQWKGRPEEEDLKVALAAIRGRAGQGIAIGGQTNDCLSQLERKLVGQPAADRCGGL